MDIFAVNENGANFLFRNDGTGRFDEVALDCGLGDGLQHGRGVAALDADGDGRFDLAYGNWEGPRSEEHTSELQSLMRTSYAVFCLKKKKINKTEDSIRQHTER